MAQGGTSVISTSEPFLSPICVHSYEPYQGRGNPCLCKAVGKNMFMG